jgi:hypothetical protein
MGRFYGSFDGELLGVYLGTHLLAVFFMSNYIDKVILFILIKLVMGKFSWDWVLWVI